MSQHPIAGERILARTKDLAGVAPIVRHEHEHWDGSGYPDGLERHRIPIGSRVMHACHAYVAMTRRRARTARRCRPTRPSRELRARRRHEVRPRRRRRPARPARPQRAGRPRPRGRRQARRADRRASLRPGGRRAGLGTGRVTSVAE